MRVLRVLALCLIAGLAGCATKNVGHYVPGQGHGGELWLLGITFSPAEPADGYIAGTVVTATANFLGDVRPFTFTIKFDSGVTPLSQTMTVGSSDVVQTASATFTIDPFLLIDEPAGRQVRLVVQGTDGGGLTTQTYGSFRVVGIPDAPPTLSTTFDPATCTVTATATDPDGDDVTVSATTVPAGLTTPPAQTLHGAGIGGVTSGSLTFQFSATDVLSGGTGDVTFTSDDGFGSTGTSTVTVSCPPFPLAPDTLYAIPLQDTVAVGDPVTIVVATGVPAGPFYYMTGARVTAPQASGFDYVPNSFNAGTPGGAAGDVDGLWTCMAPSSFLLPPDFYLGRSDAGNGLYGIEFNVTPLDGSDVTTCSGALFNFQATFTTPGTYHLGIQQADIVNRTYYNDATLTNDRFWSDISNAAAPAITVEGEE